MCKHGTDRLVDQHKLPGVNYLDGEKVVHIDECIADLVLALNDAGVYTIASCCGHEYPPGEILLKDGRILMILEPGLAIESIKVMKVDK